MAVRFGQCLAECHCVSAKVAILAAQPPLPPAPLQGHRQQRRHPLHCSAAGSNAPPLHRRRRAAGSSATARSIAAPPPVPLQRRRKQRRSIAASSSRHRKQRWRTRRVAPPAATPAPLQRSRPRMQRRRTASDVTLKRLPPTRSARSSASQQRRVDLGISLELRAAGHGGEAWAATLGAWKQAMAEKLGQQPQRVLRGPEKGSSSMEKSSGSRLEMGR